MSPKMTIALIFCGVMFVFIASFCIADAIRNYRIKRMFIQAGYEKKVIYEMPSCEGIFYGWVKGDNFILERKLQDMTIKEIKNSIIKGA